MCLRLNRPVLQVSIETISDAMSPSFFALRLVSTIEHY